MPTTKVPGVYVEEITTFPAEISSVETAIPAFIGYTKKAKQNSANDLLLIPKKLCSMRDFKRFFGGPHIDRIAISVDATADTFTVTDFTEPSLSYLLYHSVKLFFSNGGSCCYVTCVGTYQPAPTIRLAGDGSNHPATRHGLLDGLGALAGEAEPSLIAIPEAVKLAPADYQLLIEAMLAQCEAQPNRFAIIDVFDGSTPLGRNTLADNRSYLGNTNLAYGAAYYPFLRTRMNFPISKRRNSVRVTYNGAAAMTLSRIKRSNRPLYRFVKSALKTYFIALPPCSAVAGVYAATDTSRGVWKAPANRPVLDIREPVVLIDDAQQESLQLDPAGGKSINAIRAFTGKGTLVWGARTLAGNDNEWRYVPVRRFFSMLEASIKRDTAWAVFEPNDATLWVKVRTQIENYLNQQWRSGALTGNRPGEAYFVNCGLGQTMTTEDILEGRMMVEIGLAALRPAEFIVLRITHQLQIS